MNIIKPHPISTKLNLQKICHQANIAFTTTETRTQLMGKISNFADESLSNEAMTRNIVIDLSAETKKNKVQGAHVTVESSGETMELDITESIQGSQAPLFDDTQDVTEVDTETTAVTETTKDTVPTSTAPTETTAPNLKRRLPNPNEDDEVVLKKSRANETIDRVV